MTTDLKLNTIQGVTSAITKMVKMSLVNKESKPTEMGAVLESLITLIEGRGNSEVNAVMAQVRKAYQLPDAQPKQKDTLK